MSAHCCATIDQRIHQNSDRKHIVEGNRAKVKNHTATVARVKNIAEEDPLLTKQDIAEVMGISSGSISNTLKHK